MINFKEMETRRKIGILIMVSALLMFILPVIVSASNHLILGNIQQAQNNYMNLIQNVSLLVAFLGGVLSFLTPCALGILPAYFAFSFQEKRELVKMTFFFFLGMMVVFIPIGLAASFIGGLLVIYREGLAIFAGSLLVLFGVLMILGKGFSIPFLNIKKKTKKDKWGIFIFGILFGIGFTPCSGPIIVAITTLAATQTTFYAVAMFVLYGLGIATPLLILSYFFDRFNVIGRFAKKDNFKFNLMGKEFRMRWTGIIAGILFIVLGSIFIILKNTTIFTITAARFGYPLSWAYSLQTTMIKTPILANTLAGVGIIIVAIIGYLSYKKYKNKKEI
ncbi:MAG TPA: cytochrome c biogenesis protein CcdA [Ignavibacteria bacterium]|nr:cytochrome c biogenesis protein CcdA [Ignavibacteria bacterium]